MNDIRIPLNDANFAYGTGVYEVLKLRDGRLYFADLHLDRLLNSAAVVGLRHSWEASAILAALTDCIRMNNQRDINYKILLIRRSRHACDLYIYPQDLPAGFADQKSMEYPPPEGIAMAAYRGERQFPRAKTLNMLMSTIALDYAVDRGCWDAMLIAKDETILEGSRSSLFWFEDDVLCSAPEERILPGVTRLNLLSALGFADGENDGYRETSLKYDEFLSHPKPMFVCSTSMAIQPVTRLVLLNDQEIIFTDEELNPAREIAAIFREYLMMYDPVQIL